MPAAGAGVGAVAEARGEWVLCVVFCWFGFIGERASYVCDHRVYIHTHTVNHQQHPPNSLLPSERPTLVVFVIGGISPLELRECALVVRDARARRRRTGLGPKVGGGWVYVAG